MSDLKLPPIPQEGDRVNARLIAWIFASAVAVTVLSVVASGRFLEAEQRPFGSGRRDSTRPANPPEEIGMLEQTLMQEGRKGLRMARAGQERLEQYRWVDRERGIIAIPIQRAIDLALDRAASAPVPREGAKR